MTRTDRHTPLSTAPHNHTHNHSMCWHPAAAAAAAVADHPRATAHRRPLASLRVASLCFALPYAAASLALPLLMLLSSLPTASSSSSSCFPLYLAVARSILPSISPFHSSSYLVCAVHSAICYSCCSPRRRRLLTLVVVVGFYSN